MAKEVGARWLRIYDGELFDYSDLDDDGVVDFSRDFPSGDRDNCPLFANPDQADHDADGVGNVCDNCPFDFNRFQEDADEDGVGDECDLCPHDSSLAVSYRDADPTDTRHADDDFDHLANRCDLCPNLIYVMAGGRVEGGYVPPYRRYLEDIDSPLAENVDGDHSGDRCDNCKFISNWQGDSDGDTLGDDCDLCPDLNPELIGTPDFPFWHYGSGPCDVMPCEYICSYMDCTGIEPDREVVLLDSKDEAEFMGPRRRFNDWDGDDVGNMCDNCGSIANANQRNCNLDWELRTRRTDELPMVPGEDIEGDACDNEPCAKMENYPQVFPGSRGIGAEWTVVTNVSPCDLTCYEWGGDPLTVGCDMPSDDVYYAYGIFKLDTHGHDYGEGWDDPLGRPVMNAYCDCTEEHYLGDELENCETDNHCGKYGRVERDFLGNGWYHFSRLLVTEEPEMPDFPVHGRDLPRDDFFHLFRRDYCGNRDLHCYSIPVADGCHENDASDCPGELYLFWDFIRDLGKDWAAGFPRYFFKPSDESFTGDLILKNAQYTDRIVALGMPSCPTIELPGGRPPEEFRYSDPIPYLPTDEEGCPGPGVELKDSVKFRAFPCWMPPELVGAWRYENVETTSATQGIMVERFDRNDLRHVGFYHSIFENPGDIMDTEGFCAACLEEEGAPSAAQSWEDPAVQDLPCTLWVFGGQDLASFRNDVWRGRPEYSSAGEIVFRWDRITFGTGAPGSPAAPAGRREAAMFTDTELGKLFIWGGTGEEGPLDDLWAFDLSSLVWAKIDLLPSFSPPPLSDFVFTQAGRRGFVWGGTTTDGMDNPYLYEFSAAGPGFIRIETASPPPRLSEPAFTADPSGRLLYLFGGFDGAGFHNWLWTLDLGDRSWSMTIPDCLSGPCPYTSAAPVFYGDADAGRFVALPGHAALSGSPAYSQEYFLFDLDSGEWAPASHRSGTASAAGDCDGDGEPDPGHSSLCRTFQDWWNVPGRMLCDTMTSSLVCMQPAGSMAAQYGMNRSGAVDIDAVGNALFISKGNRIHVFDMSAPEAPVEVTNLKLKQKVKDLEQDQGILAAAAGNRIVVIDVSSPFSPVILSDTPSCGNVTGLEVSGSRVTFLTNIGLGILDIGDPSAPSLAGFASLLDGGDGTWTAVDFFTGCGDGSLPASPMVPFAAGDGMAFIGAASGLLMVRLGDVGYEVSSFLELPSSIDELKYDRGSVYLNLHDGSRIAVDVSPAGEAVVSGTHDLEDWVRGIVSGNGKAYRLTGNQIQTAILR